MTVEAHNAAYAEMLEDTPRLARERERAAIERAIELLHLAQEKGAGSREAAEALLYLNRLWSIFMEDLGSAENDLPRELRANLISIGIWVMREVDQIRSGQSVNFSALIGVMKTIGEGLR
jgi:flagellar protein FlaF